MAEHFFSLTAADQRDALLQAASDLGRPAYLLEKDVWVVWALHALFASDAGRHLTFKGGTSLSKVYRLIDRFSEDIDLTYDIRQIMDGHAQDELPASRAQARRWSDTARERLPEHLATVVCPMLRQAIEREGVQAELAHDGDKIYLKYVTRTPADTYIQPRVMLEFGARSSGEPNAIHPVTCDMAIALQGLVFPQANPRVMHVARTFWEKATAAHVYCAQARLKGERFARHWHDLATIARSSHFDGVATNREVAERVADHKQWFFRERSQTMEWIDYRTAVQGNLRLVPEGDARAQLEEDYGRMLEGGMFDSEPMAFDALMETCAALEARLSATQV